MIEFLLHELPHHQLRLFEADKSEALIIDEYGTDKVDGSSGIEGNEAFGGEILVKLGNNLLDIFLGGH